MQENEARGIRTPNLRVWNPTRCHCAIASLPVGLGPDQKSTPCGIRTHNPQIRSLMRYPIAPMGLCYDQKGKVPSPGFEPGSVG